MTLPYRKIAELDAERMERVADEHGFIAELLNSAGIPSLSPGTAGQLIGVVEAIDALLKRPDLPEQAHQIFVTYRDQLVTIAKVAAHQQRGVIASIERALRRQHASDLGVGDPDAIEMYEMLVKLGNLGRRS